MRHSTLVLDVVSEWPTLAMYVSLFQHDVVASYIIYA